MKKIIDIIESIANEKGLEIEDINEALKNALVNTAKRVFGEEFEYGVEIDAENRDLKLYQKVVVVEDDDIKAKESENFIFLSEAQELDPSIDIGDELTYDVELDNLGRTASATLYGELEFHIQRKVEENILGKYQDKIGKRVAGNVVRVDEIESTFIEIDEVRAIMPKKFRIKGEKFRVGDVVRGIIKKVSIDPKVGMIVEFSRTSPKFLEELLRLQVPEIKDEIITIHNIARIPGVRAKIALSSSDVKVDAIGSTVGNSGVRINAISRELHNESIDCIEYSSIPEIFISRALSPAMVSKVEIKKNTIIRTRYGKKVEQNAAVTIPSDQKSKAIGKAGINIRLASMLTKYKIELIEDETISLNRNNKIFSNDKGNALKALFD